MRAASSIAPAADRATRWQEKLTRDGIKALPYHAGMESKERTRNQEAFLRDDARRDHGNDRVRHGH
jgi:superfamily II DNA helicase RecQ